MARIKKYSPTIDPHLKYYETFLVDTDPNSQYFKITEFKDVFTGGKNAFLIEGSEYLMETTEIKIEILDVAGNPIYFEPGQGIPQYYEGISKVVAVYVYEDTPIGDANITVLGELKQYFDGAELKDIPAEWKGIYNVKWQKNFKTNRLLSNEDKVRFYKRPVVNITELVKPLFTTALTTVTQKGLVNGTPITPANGQSLANYSLPTYYKLTTTDDTFWTGSVAGTTLEFLDLGYTPIVNEVINARELLVSTPYTINGNVVPFTAQGYTASFSYLEGIDKTASALTGSFAKINITDLKTFTGDVARVKVFRKSESYIGDYQFVQEVVLESNELLVDLETVTKNQENYGILTNSIIKNYWVTSSNAISATFNQNYLYDSVKLDSPISNYFYTTKSLSTNEGKEYTLSFNVRLGANTSGNNYIRAFLSGSKQSVISNITKTIQVEQDFTKIYSDDNLLVKSTSTNNITAEQIDNPKLYFEVVGNGWYIANVSFTAAQETAFSPDEITFIQSVPRSLPAETFDYRFEFYDINNNYVPVRVEQQKLFNGGNLQNIQKSLKLLPSQFYFQFDSGSNPIPPTVLSIAIQKTLLTGSVTFTSSSIDFDGNVLTYSDYTASFTGKQYPGLLGNITSDTPFLTVQNFTGSRTDKTVQYLEITGETEGYKDTIVISRVLDGFGGVNHIIRPYRGTQIRNSSTSSLEIQAIRIDGVNDIKLSSTTEPGKGWPDTQLHIISRSIDGNEKFVNLSYASASGYVKGLTTGSIGSGEINYNATFNRDSIDYRRILYLMSSASAASGPAYNVSSSVLTSIILEDLQDGLNTGVVTYNSDVFNINYRNALDFTPTFAFATASFTTRTTDSAIVTASFQVFPSMSINKDYLPEYWMYYTTQSCNTESIAITAIDENKNIINSKAVDGLGLSTNQSKKLTITFTYTEPWTSASISIDKTFTIIPEGKPGDESIVYEVNPYSVNLNSNAKGVILDYSPSITDIKLKQGSRYLVFTGSRVPGTFYIATASISQSNINVGNIHFTSSYGVDYTASLIVSSSSNFTQLSGSIIFPLEIQPYYTSSIYTGSVTQQFTKVVDGAPPVQVLITPPNVTFAANQIGIIKNYGLANTIIKLKEGNDYLVYTSSKQPGTFQTSSIITNNINISSLTPNLLDKTQLNVGGYNGMDENSGSIQYNFTVYPYSLLPGHRTGSIEASGSQTFIRTKDGDAARSVSIATTSQTVNFDGDGVVVSPEGSIFLTATAFNMTGSAYYTFYKDDVVYSPIQTLNIFELSSGDATSPGETSVWKVDVRDGSPSLPPVASAEVTIAGIKAGAESYNAVLTNENSSAVYKVSGQLSLDGTGTSIRAYKGNSELTPVTTYTNQTYDLKGNYIGSIGEFIVTVDSKSSFITLPAAAPSGNPATMGNITAWEYPITNTIGYIVYKIDIEDGRATFYKTQSLSIQFEGNTGPGIVMRGVWSASLDYIGSVETTNYRRDAVIYPDPATSGGETTYYAAISGSGPNTNDLNSNPVGYHAPTGTTSDNAWWQYLGTQEFFVAAKIAIFDESYVKNTINVGTKDVTGAFANIVIAGGRPDPYIALGQTGTQGTAGTSGTSVSIPGVIGYDRPGIFLGIYESGTSGGGSGTTGRFSIKNTAGNRYLRWTGDSLQIAGDITVTGGDAATQTYASASASTAYTNSLSKVQLLADGGYSGSFIGSTTIYSPNIGGQNGYISNIFKVGQNGITLDGITKKIYIGTGNFANVDTPFYVDNSGNFSLKDKLYWDGTKLIVMGEVRSTTGYLGSWKIDGDSLKSSGGNIELNGSSESITLYDSSGDLRFLANTDTSLPTTNGGGAIPNTLTLGTSIYTHSTTEQSNDGTFVDYVEAGSFVAGTNGKHIIKYVMSTNVSNSGYSKAGGDGASTFYMTLTVRSASGGGGTEYGSATYTLSADGIWYYEGAGIYTAGEVIDNLLKPKTWTVSTNTLTSGTTYYVTMELTSILSSNITIPTKGDSSTASTYFHSVDSNSITINSTSAGTVINGGGFQALLNSNKYLKVSNGTDGGAGSTLDYSTSIKGNLNVKDGTIISDTSQIPGWGPAVKVFAYLSSLTSATPSYNGYGVTAINKSGTGQYTVTINDQGTTNYTVVTGILGENGGTAFDVNQASKIAVKVISATQFQITTIRVDNKDRIDPTAIYFSVLYN